MFDGRILLTAVGACSLVATSSGYAQTTFNEPQVNTLPEVLVTAQKRDERLLDVPMSITTATGQQLKDAGVVDVGDLQKVTPGFTFQPSSSGQPVYSIRGVGFFTGTASVAPTVGIYVDQVPLPFSAMTHGVGIDLQRVEVLKGPQGTLFGQNSTGGAINFIANKPTSRFETGGEISYGTFNEVDADGYVSGPLSDTLAARLALGTDRRGTWQQSESRPGDGLGRRDFSDGRLLLDWKPADKVSFEFGLSGWIDHSDTKAGQFLAFRPAVPSPPGYNDIFAGELAYQAAHTPAPNDARAADWVPNESFRNGDNFYQTSLRADWGISDSATLTSITSYDRLRQNDPQTEGGSPLPDLDIRIEDSIQTFAQELRLAGLTDGRSLRWMVGGNYEKDTADELFTGLNYDAPNSGVGPFRYHHFGMQIDQSIRTAAGFGSLDYDLSPNLTAQGSARYTRTDNSFHGCLRDGGDGALSNAFTFLDQVILGNAGAVNPGPGNCVTIDPATAQFVPRVTSDLSQSNESWRVSLNWKPISDALVYGNITRGYKAGAYNIIPAIYTTQFQPVTQESLLAYELGFKRELRDIGIQLTGAAFYYDYTNKQLLGVIPEPVFGHLQGLVTIPKSSVAGAEFGFIWQPVRQLTLETAGTYVHSQVKGTFLTSNPFGDIVDIKGEAFPNSPSWQLISNLRFEFPLGQQLSGFAGAGVQYVSDSYAAFGEIPALKLKAHALLDLRAGVTNGHWRAEIWGKNVTNTFYQVSADYFADTVDRSNGLPATFGITLAYDFR